MKCSHEVKLNEEEDFVFCIKCGKRWIAKVETLFIPHTVVSDTKVTGVKFPDIIEDKWNDALTDVARNLETFLADKFNNTTGANEDGVWPEL